MNSELCEHDMSKKLGPFNAWQLLYFPNLTFIDLSGCIFFNAQHFVDVSVGMKKLKELNYSGVCSVS